MKNKWNIALLFLIPFGELKSIFYHSNLKVDWYLLSDNQRYLCYAIEDYSIAITFITAFAYMYWAKRTSLGMEIVKFLFVVSVLDLLHLGAFDKQGLIFAKFALAILIWLLWRKKPLSKIKETWLQ